MSVVGVISDVHGNLPALRTVVARLRDEGATRWICAGDLVGYGAAPDACVELVLDLPEIVAVLGNHDLFALGRLDPGRHGEAVRTSSEWTRKHLGSTARSALELLPERALTQDGIAVVHGGVGDPERYVRTDEQAACELDAVIADPAARGLVLGHTHRPLRYARDGRWVLNPGAVGQSRERRRRARGALLDPATGEARLICLRYDVAAARDAQKRAGLPEEFLHFPPRPFAMRAIRRLTRTIGLRQRG